MTLTTCILSVGAMFVTAVACAAAEAEKAPLPVPVKEKDPKLARVETDFSALFDALKSYRILTGIYPIREQGLAALMAKPTVEPVPRRWTQFVMKMPEDPWGRDYRYITRKKGEVEQHIITSDGPDEKDSGDNIEFVLEDHEG